MALIVKFLHSTSSIDSTLSTCCVSIGHGKSHELVERTTEHVDDQRIHVSLHISVRLSRIRTLPDAESDIRPDSTYFEQKGAITQNHQRVRTSYHKRAY